MLLLFKPFKVGDVIEANGYTGKVSEIQIFNTILTNPSNITYILPNGPLSTSSIKNLSTNPQRRVDFTFGIGYGDSVQKARELLLTLINADKRILTEGAMAPFIALAELGDSSVNLTVRVWVDSPNYWGVFFDMNENVYNVFSESGINIPFPQMDVHVHNNNA